MVAVGSCHGDLTDSLIQQLMEHAERHSSETHLRHLALGLALLYLGETSLLVRLLVPLLYMCYTGKQEAAETTMAALQAVADPLGQWARTLLQICAYAGKRLLWWKYSS